MGWRNFVVLTVVLGACAPELPLTFYVSSSCSVWEEEPIKESGDMWNMASCTNVFQYAGVNDDLVFNENEDIQDGKLTVYCAEVSEMTGEARRRFENNPNLVGHSSGDIVLAIDRIRVFAKNNLRAVQFDLQTYYFQLVREIAAHELAHRADFGHQFFEADGSAMKEAGRATFTPSLLDIWGSDKQDGLCDRYPCPPPEQCPTRPTE